MQFKVSMNEIRIILSSQMGETSGLIESLSLGKDQTSPLRVIMHDYGPFHSIVGLDKLIAALPHYSEAVG